MYKNKSYYIKILKKWTMVQRNADPFLCFPRNMLIMNEWVIEWMNEWMSAEWLFSFFKWTSVLDFMWFALVFFAFSSLTLVCLMVLLGFNRNPIKIMTLKWYKNWSFAATSSWLKTTSKRINIYSNSFFSLVAEFSLHPCAFYMIFSVDLLVVVPGCSIFTKQDGL